MGSDMTKNARQKIVIKLSGSIFNFKTQSATLKKYAALLIALTDKVQPIIVTGGGKIARYYIELARTLNSDEATLDALGIDVSRLNARLLLTAIGHVGYPQIPKTLDEVAIAVEFNKIVVAGGLHPGQSTNATSALISEKIGADTLINATDVPGIYDKDPSVNSDARMFSELSVDKCMELLRQKNSQAGTYELMDLVALKVIHRSKIQTIVTKADIDTLKDIILNGSNIGTRITF
jgi:uridylate kinase